MKACRYNFFVPNQDRMICFNALSGKVFSVNKEEYAAMQSCLKNPDSFGKLRKFLYDNKFLIDDDFDEVNYIILRNRIEVFSQVFHLIINPTLECNFNCWYCYEKNIKGSMSSDTIQNIKNFLSRKVENHEITGLDLSWFGGEPLLYYKEVVLPISLFAKDLMAANNLSFSNGITTNGYLIDDEMIDGLKLIDMNFFQITLDGSENSHNLTRNQKGEPSYQRIISNIIKLCQSNDKVRIRLRINYTNKILRQDFKEIFDHFPPEQRHKIAIDFQRVWQTTREVSHPGCNNEDVISKVELSREMGFAFGLDAKYTIGRYHQCYVDRYNHAHVNYDGRVYKCSARNYSDKYVYGELLNTGEIKYKSGILEKMYTRANFENDKCLPCKLLPLCIGPCYQRYLDYLNKEKTDCCIHSNKEIEVDTFIKEYYMNVRNEHELNKKEKTVSKSLSVLYTTGENLDKS